MKRTLHCLVLLLIAAAVRAQRIDSIYVNLYTDSLKKGTCNYINVDGLLSNGRYLPLDSTHLIFQASAGWFQGNGLWIEKNFAEEKVHITVTLRSNRAIFKEFDVYIKKAVQTEPLKTAEQVMEELQRGKKKKRRN